MTLTTGQPCPRFELVAAVSGRPIGPDHLAGRRAVLVLHGPRTADAPKAVGKAVRAAFPSADDVLVANIVNLRSMAGLWKKVADAQIKATYEKMAVKVEGDPADYIVICPDYDNMVAPAFGFEDTNQDAAVVVLGTNGTVLGATDEDELAKRALDWLKR